MLQQIDNGAASKKLDLGLDLIDPRSSFIHIFYSRVVYIVSQKKYPFFGYSPSTKGNFLWDSVYSTKLHDFYGCHINQL